MIPTDQQLRALAEEFGWPRYRAEQVRQAVYVRRIARYADMTALPLAVRERLIERFGDAVCRIEQVRRTSDEQADKRLFRLPDGHRIEAVALRFARGWHSYCISSQCGCAMGCAFCATGAMGFARDMTAGEIADQLLFFHMEGLPLDSVSFMGMGEPLMNPHLPDAIRLLTDPMGLALGQRRLTVSTTGIAPGIRMLTQTFPQVNLAFSLHTPYDRQRSELMPVNRRYPLAEVLGALDAHARATGRRVFLAYLLLRGVNDSDAHIHALAQLVKARGVRRSLYHIDLIPYNPGNTRRRFAATDAHRAQAIRAMLEADGISASVRAQFGTRIGAGCGQLCEGGDGAQPGARRDIQHAK